MWLWRNMLPVLLTVLLVECLDQAVFPEDQANGRVVQNALLAFSRAVMLDETMFFVLGRPRVFPTEKNTLPCSRTGKNL